MEVVYLYLKIVWLAWMYKETVSGFKSSYTPEVFLCFMKVTSEKGASVTVMTYTVIFCGVL